MSGKALAGLVTAVALVAAACTTHNFDDRYTEARDPCSEFNTERNAYWGDLHLHTGFSFDAWVYGNHLTPGDAYRFAKGESVRLPPLDAQGNPTQQVQLARPLDFAMVSDHSEFLGEIGLCTTPGSPGYDSSICTSYRAGGPNAVTFFGTQTALWPPTRFDLCGPSEPDCYLSALDARWQAIQDAAELHYDRSSRCEFVSFVGYEYTATTDVVNLHRNVIFRNARVVGRPISYFEANTPYALWRALRDECLDAGIDCEVMTIGHNANLSNGHYYGPDYDSATGGSRGGRGGRAALPARAPHRDVPTQGRRGVPQRLCHR